MPRPSQASGCFNHDIPVWRTCIRARTEGVGFRVLYVRFPVKCSAGAPASAETEFEWSPSWPKVYCSVGPPPTSAPSCGYGRNIKAHKHCIIHPDPSYISLGFSRLLCKFVRHCIHPGRLQEGVGQWHGFRTLNPDR